METQWSTFSRAVIIAISLILIIWLIYTIQPIIDPLIIAALVAYILNPLVKLVRARTRLQHNWAVALVYFSGLALLIIIPSILAPVAIRQTQGLSGYLLNIEEQLEATLAKPVNIAGQQLHLGQLLADFLKVTSQSLTPAAQGALAVLERTSTSLVWLLIILVSAYYFLLDWEALQEWLVRLAPEAAQADVRRLLQETGAIWQAYMNGTFVLMIIVAVVFTLAWVAIGLPGAVALGLLTGVLTVIPEIGPAIAAMLAVLVAFFQGSDFLPLSNFWFAGLVFTIYLVLIQIKSIWLRPRIMGRFLHMNEGLIFVAIIAAAVLWGILGALIIVPLLATAGLVGRYVRARLLQLEPWPEVVDHTPSATGPNTIETPVQPQPVVPPNVTIHLPPPD